MSLKDQILSAADVSLHPVNVPEWGCTVYVPILTLAEASELQHAVGKNDDTKFTTLAAFIIRDEHGKRVFEAADVPALAQKSLAAAKRVVDEYNRVNGNNEDDDAKN